MDITFKTKEGLFNYRVCAVIINNGKILAMKNQRAPFYFLPGGRVHLHEEAQEAILREIREELGIVAKILRPLWLNQGFFVEDVTGEKFHEICIYFLVDVSETELMARGDSFIISEAEDTNHFQWLPFDSLKNEYFYPLFIKEKIFNLPQTLTLIAEYD